MEKHLQAPRACMNQLTEEGLVMIKVFEGLRLKAYQDEGGIWTIGYGHIDGVKKGQQCSIEQAEKWLMHDIRIKAETPIKNFIVKPLNNNQYSALVSLVFNCGNAPLKGTLGTYLLAGNYPEVAEQFLRWKYVNKKESKGLLRRRKAERALFLTSMER